MVLLIFTLLQRGQESWFGEVLTKASVKLSSLGGPLGTSMTTYLHSPETAIPLWGFLSVLGPFS